MGKLLMAVASRLNFPTPIPALIGTSGKAGEMTGRRGGGQYSVPTCMFVSMDDSSSW